MAKTEKKSLKELGAEIESQSKDMAYKIWLAGVGAYGRAYTETKTGAERVNEAAAELFEDLVSRGAEIENDVRERISENDTVTKSRDRFSKLVDTATSFQEKQRERFDTRLERMRGLLGFSRPDEQIAELTRQVEALSAQLSAFTGAAKPKAATARKAKTAPAERVAELAEAVAPKPAKRKAPAKRKTAAKPAARKATRARKTA